jgi:adenylate cyclase class 2
LEFWGVRLRDEGNRITLAYKQRFDVGDNILRDGGMHEVEVVVSDFEEVDRLLKAIGLLEKFYEENRRIRYVLGSLTFDIDMWPLLKPYLEIEGDTWENVEKISEKLGFSWEDHLRCSTMQVYEKEGINENDYAVLTFEQQIKKHL